MKKVTAFVGSAHKKNTQKAVSQFLENLKALGEVEVEIVTLTDYQLGICRGCRVCFEKGEAFCPLKDDRDVLFAKISSSDGVVFATPNYCFQMSGILKVFLDRFGYAIHRPCYFGKTFTSIVSQGFGGGADILKNLDFFANLLGFKTLKGIAVTGFDPRSEKEQRKIDRDLSAHARRYYALLSKPPLTTPSFYQVIIFRMGRAIMRQEADHNSVDYRYYTERGWLTSDYYYPARLGLPKKAAGALMDSAAALVRAFMA